MSSRQEKILRVIDANFNRAREGLRVCEDVCRFFCDHKSLTVKYKLLRHELTQAVCSLKMAWLTISLGAKFESGW